VPIHAHLSDTLNENGGNNAVWDRSWNNFQSKIHFKRKYNSVIYNYIIHSLDFANPADFETRT
jgi:hypothetical protein